MERALALTVAGLAVAAILGQAMSLPEGAPVDLLGRVWLMAGYFTVLTNALIAVAMAARALGARLPATWALALLVAILIVAAVYHGILAALWSPRGLAWWSDQGLHSAVPLAFALWWTGFADKRLGWGAVAASLAWPLAYGAYALVRGALTGFWPYPFLDAGVLGPWAVARNLAALSLAFAALAAVLVAGARRFSR